MSSEIIIDVQQDDISIALLEDKTLVEFSKTPKQMNYSVGDIYLGKVHKIMPGLNAAFVNVGSEREAFLHYLDLGENFISIGNFTKQLLSNKKVVPDISNLNITKELPKEGKITDYLQTGQEIIVQIVKEPISTKGPRLTADLSIAGRYLVLIPFNDSVSVSQKIKSREERKRLRDAIQLVKPKNFGVIIRTVAEGRDTEELTGELRLLSERWENAMKKAEQGKSPQLLLSEMDRSVSILRDLFNANFQAIHVNDEATLHEIQDYLTSISPEKKNIVKLAKSAQPIFDTFGVTKQLKSSMGRVVAMKNGAYLVIEHTEALHVIDVNSGNRFKKEDGQEANALEVNLLAAHEIARQLRLRDMGGIIVVDFIDMATATNRNLLYETMREAMAGDRARHNILPLSKFGLMQITRHRVRPVIDMETTEVCPTCLGKGVSQPTLLFAERLEDKIAYIARQMNERTFTLQVHPYVYAYLKKGFPSLFLRWKWRYGMGIKLLKRDNFGMVQYQFLNSKGKEIDMHDSLVSKRQS